MQGVELELELEVESDLRFNIVKGATCKWAGNQRVVFGRRDINGKLDVELDCIIVYSSNSVNQSTVSAEHLIYI